MNIEDKKTLAWAIYALANEESSCLINMDEFVERSIKCIDEALTIPVVMPTLLRYIGEGDLDMTLGKKYTYIKENYHFFLMKNDDGNIVHKFKYKFEVLEKK